jgi:hypothetical protein
MAGETSGVPVSIQYAVPIRSPRVFDTGAIIIPGVATGVAYASGDALGTQIAFTVPQSGLIQGAVFVNQSAQSIALDIILFKDFFDGGTDNAAFDMTDANYVRLIGGISISTFFSFNDNVYAQAFNLGIPYNLGDKNLLWVQAVIRGIVTAVAVSDYTLRLLILPDEAQGG